MRIRDGFLLRHCLFFLFFLGEAHVTDQENDTNETAMENEETKIDPNKQGKLCSYTSR